MPIPEKSDFRPRTSAKERVYLTLRQWIIDGTLEPGERLNDTELAKYFSVSRTPVREALQLLDEQKFVQIAPSNGTYVAPIDNEDMKCVYELLAEMQAIAVGLCINNIAPENFSHLEELNETFLRRARNGTAADANEADFQFHHDLCQLANNPYLLDFSDRLALQAQRNENYYFSEVNTPEASYQAHKLILEALRNKDVSTAQREIRQNWLVSLKRKAT